MHGLTLAYPCTTSFTKLVSLGTELQSLKSKLSYDQRSFGQYLLVSGHHLGPVTNFYFIFCRYFLYTAAGLLLWDALSDERTIYNLQLLLGLASAVVLGSEFHRTHDQIFLLKSDNPLIWRARFSYVFCPRTG
jgi:hypothetical protein